MVTEIFIAKCKLLLTVNQITYSVCLEIPASETWNHIMQAFDGNLQGYFTCSSLVWLPIYTRDLDIIYANKLATGPIHLTDFAIKTKIQVKHI